MRVNPCRSSKAEWPDEVGLAPLDATGRPQDVRRGQDGGRPDDRVLRGDGRGRCREPREADGRGSAALDHLGAAEKLLAAALRFHEYAREHSYPDRKIPIRSGKGWDELRTSLTGKLRTVRLDYLRAALAAKDTARIRELSTRLMNAYPKDAGVAKAVAVARIGEVERLIESGNHPDHVRAKELLDEFEARYPGAGGDSARKLRGQLRDTRPEGIRAGPAKESRGRPHQRARRTRAAPRHSIPTIDGVREMQRELRTGYPILYVGVRQFPAHMSPATARLDSERQAVELLFEGLLEEVPDESGAVRYRPGVAVAMPTAVPGGRDFVLRTFERDATGRPGFDSHDLVGTVKLLRDRTAHRGPRIPLAWLDQDPPRPRDAGSVRLALRGRPSRSAQRFSPSSSCRRAGSRTNGKAIDDAAFAEKPFGTGPFKLQGRTNPEPGVRAR